MYGLSSSGFLRPSNGTAYLNSLDIRSNMVKIRQSLGFCPQHNILFDDLTVTEHFKFFSKVRKCFGSMQNNWGSFNQPLMLPVKNVTWIFSCLFEKSSSVWFENETKSNGNRIMFLGNAMEIPWLELVQNPCHVPAWKKNPNWINDI